ncbi:MAG: hypothetical protein ACE37E_08425 [Hyphomicrobiales bacterium]
MAGSVIRLCLLSALATLLAACSMVGSTNVPPVGFASSAAPACRSTLGSYTLPRQLLTFTISRPTNGTQSVDHRMSEVDLTTVTDDPDRFTFCFDHLSNALADDRIIVNRSRPVPDGDGKPTDETEQTPFIQTVATNATDRSVGIVRRLIRTVFDVLAQSGGLGRSIDLSDPQTVVASHEVDPFDPVEMAQVNAAIRQYGFCIIFDAYSFDPRHVSADSYCDNPIHQESRHPSPSAHAVAQQDFLGERPVSGILYRPAIPYALAIYTKRDPDGPGPWRLSVMQTLQLTNASPIVAVNVGRAFFAEQRGALLFYDGTLEDVCIARGGQLAGLIEIPLEIVYGIVNLPAERIKAAIDSNTTRRQLIEAQVELIAAQRAYIDYLQGGAEPPESRRSASSLDIGPTTANTTFTLGNDVDDGAFPSSVGGESSAGSIVPVKGFESICDLSQRDLPNNIEGITQPRRAG